MEGLLIPHAVSCCIMQLLLLLLRAVIRRRWTGKGRVETYFLFPTFISHMCPCAAKRPGAEWNMPRNRYFKYKIVDFFNFFSKFPVTSKCRCVQYFSPLLPLWLRLYTSLCMCYISFADATYGVARSCSTIRAFAFNLKTFFPHASRILWRSENPILQSRTLASLNADTADNAVTGCKLLFRKRTCYHL